MKFLGLDKVLCLSPHPDDVEYGMLGSIIKYEDTDFDIFVLSSGGDFDTTTGMSRIKETEDAVVGLKNCNCILNDEPTFVKDKSEDEWIYEIETKFDISSYDTILVPPPEDSHFEHRKINTFSQSLVRRIKCGIINYRTPSTIDTWIPNFFVDLDFFSNTYSSKILDEKINRLQKFESQKSKSYFSSDSISSFHNNYQCSQRNMFAVELFRIERLYS